jgi:hypothetical protein
VGVILDSKLNWNQHLQKIIRKTQTTFALDVHVVGNGILDLVWYTGSTLG